MLKAAAPLDRLFDMAVCTPSLGTWLAPEPVEGEAGSLSVMHTCDLVTRPSKSTQPASPHAG